MLFITSVTWTSFARWPGTPLAGLLHCSIPHKDCVYAHTVQGLGSRLPVPGLATLLNTPHGLISRPSTLYKGEVPAICTCTSAMPCSKLVYRPVFSAPYGPGLSLGHRCSEFRGATQYLYRICASQVVDHIAFFHINCWIEQQCTSACRWYFRRARHIPYSLKKTRGYVASRHFDPTSLKNLTWYLPQHNHSLSLLRRFQHVLNSRHVQRKPSKSPKKAVTIKMRRRLRTSYVGQLNYHTRSRKHSRVRGRRRVRRLIRGRTCGLVNSPCDEIFDALPKLLLRLNHRLGKRLAVEGVVGIIQQVLHNRRSVGG